MSMSMSLHTLTKKSGVYITGEVFCFRIAWVLFSSFLACFVRKTLSPFRLQQQTSILPSVLRINYSFHHRYGSISYRLLIDSFFLSFNIS
jgi:hypothetical protein